jgi:hypothetical protein
MRVLNATRRDQKLTKGFPLAHCEAVTLVAPPDVGQRQVKDSIPRLQDVMAAAWPNLNNTQSQELEELLAKYGGIFAMKSDDCGRTGRVHHRIDTGEPQPNRQPPRMILLTKDADVERC